MSIAQVCRSSSAFGRYDNPIFDFRIVAVESDRSRKILYVAGICSAVTDFYNLVVCARTSPIYQAND